MHLVHRRHLSPPVGLCTLAQPAVQAVSFWPHASFIPCIVGQRSCCMDFSKFSRDFVSKWCSLSYTSFSCHVGNWELGKLQAQTWNLEHGSKRRTWDNICNKIQNTSALLQMFWVLGKENKYSKVANSIFFSCSEQKLSYFFWSCLIFVKMSPDTAFCFQLGHAVSSKVLVNTEGKIGLINDSCWTAFYFATCGPLTV